MKRKSIIYLLFFTIPLSINAQNYKLVWSDEFNENSLNKNWNVEVLDKPYNNELQCYTNRSSNVNIENGNLVSHYRIMCLRKNGAALINFVDGRVTDGFILREGEFVTSLQALKEIGIKAGFSAFAEE